MPGSHRRAARDRDHGWPRHDGRRIPTGTPEAAFRHIATNLFFIRVLQISPAFEPHIGGVEAAVREISKRLASRGHDVDVLTTDETHELEREERLHGVDVRRVRAWPKGGDQRLAPGILRQIGGRGYDVVHIHSYQTFVAPLAMMAAARAGIPYLVTFHAGGHSARYRNALRPLQLRILRPLLARAAALVATAKWEIPHYGAALRLSEDRFVLVPNGSDLPRVDVPARMAANTIVSLGRAEQYKGHHLAIAALPQVIAEVPDARLWIAGEGPYAADLQALAAELGVADRVEIRVVRDRAQYAAEVKGCALAILFSEFETHPVAVIEAAALGVPLVVARTPGLSELVDDGVATGVELGAGTTEHARAMVRALLSTSTAPAIAMPSWEDGTSQLEELYRAATTAPDHRRPGRLSGPGVGVGGW